MKIDIKIDENIFNVEGKAEDIREAAIAFISGCTSKYSESLNNAIQDIRAMATIIINEAKETNIKAKAMLAEDAEHEKSNGY